MKVIYNRYLPFGRFTAINLFGIVFAKDKYKYLSERELNHEKIHSCQILELLGVFYYPFYIGEWFFRLVQYRSWLEAYRNISFEREAYDQDKNLSYLKERKLFSFVHYYKNKKR